MKKVTEGGHHQVLLLALPQARHSSLCSSLWDVFLKRNISGPEVVCPLHCAVPKLILLPGTKTTKYVDIDRSK